MFVVDVRGKRYLPTRATDEHDAMSRVAAYRVAVGAATGHAVDYRVRTVESGEQLPPVVIVF